jgi:hypothetical protein
MSVLQKQTRILTEHNGNGTHNAAAAASVKALFSVPLSITDTTWFKYYESSQQTITAAGPLTLAHGLGAKPQLVQVSLVCQTAEYGYSIGDEVIINPFLNRGLANDQGVVIVLDSTNLNIRYGAYGSGVFSGLRKDTGASIAFTDANWKAVFRAWA